MRIQKDLLETPNCDISYPFLQSFAAVVKPRWTYLAPHLKLFPRKQQQGRGGKKEILPLLEEWKQRTHATYGNLLDVLDSLYLLPPLTVYHEQSIHRIENSSKLHNVANAVVLFIYSCFNCLSKKLDKEVTLPLKFLLIQQQLPYTPNMLTGVGRRYVSVTLASLSTSLNMQFHTEI